MPCKVTIEFDIIWKICSLSIRALRKILTFGKILIGRGKESVRECKICGIFAKFPENLSKKGEPCANGISNPLSERV